MGEDRSVETVRYGRVLGNAQAALSELSRFLIPPTPRLFELLYESFSGTNPGLKERIGLELRKPNLRRSDLEQICDDYLGKLETDKDTLEYANRLTGSIEQVRVAMEQSSLSVSGFTDILGSSGDSLSGSLDSPSLRQITEHLLSETRCAQIAHRQLEASLQASRAAIAALQADLEKVRGEAVIDALTGAYNRRYLDRELAKLVYHSTDSNSRLALIMIDIDHFKKFNDVWGHQTGDQVLRHVATTLKTKLREVDIVARYGGEEFVALLPDTELRGGIAAANKVRQFLAEGSLVKRSTEEKLGQITASFGVVVCNSSDVPTALLERADRCLYAAKNAGRNCVVGEDELQAV